jgi:hypothetical protein
MERGPLALFGAILAVGIGPALWLGAQFGDLDVAPSRTPAVVSEQKADKAPGGAGAAPEDPTTEPTKRTRYVPLSGTPSARPSSSASAADEPDDQVTSKPPKSVEPSQPDDETTPPTEGTTNPETPTDPSAGEDPVPPQPPEVGDPAGGQAAGEASSQTGG